eukprot:2961561-Amphidinium_carterae.1
MMNFTTPSNSCCVVANSSFSATHFVLVKPPMSPERFLRSCASHLPTLFCWSAARRVANCTSTSFRPLPLATRSLAATTASAASALSSLPIPECAALPLQPPKPLQPRLLSCLRPFLDC